MNDVIRHLEGKLQKLVQFCQHLKAENQTLQKNQNFLLKEKDLLAAKHKIAISQIEAMVTRLKSIEKPSS